MKATLIYELDYIIFRKHDDWENPIFITQYELPEKVGESVGNFNGGSGTSGMIKTTNLIHFFLFGRPAYTEQIFQLVRTFPALHERGIDDRKRPLSVTFDINEIQEAPPKKRDWEWMKEAKAQTKKDPKFKDMFLSYFHPIADKEVFDYVNGD